MNKKLPKVHKQAVDDRIKRKGARFDCGHLVRPNAYVTIAFNDAKPGRKPSWRVRCIQCHRKKVAASMRNLRKRRGHGN